MTGSGNTNEFAALLSEVFTDATAENLKTPATSATSTADDEHKSCHCKENLQALAKKLKPNVLLTKLGKCGGK